MFSCIISARFKQFECIFLTGSISFDRIVDFVGNSKGEKLYAYDFL